MGGEGFNCKWLGRDLSRILKKYGSVSTLLSLILALNFVLLYDSRLVLFDVYTKSI